MVSLRTGQPGSTYEMGVVVGGLTSGRNQIWPNIMATNQGSTNSIYRISKVIRNAKTRYGTKFGCTRVRDRAQIYECIGSKMAAVRCEEPGGVYWNAEVGAE